MHLLSTILSLFSVCNFFKTALHEDDLYLLLQYPNGGRDVQKIVDRPGVQAQEEWVEKVPIQKYIRYTAEELEAAGCTVVPAAWVLDAPISTRFCAISCHVPPNSAAGLVELVL